MEYTVTTKKYDNCIVRIHRPVLTDEERERRMDILRSEAAKFIKVALTYVERS